MLVCGWLCTLYDGLLWLHEQPSLVTSALDLIVWISAYGTCCRCIFTLYCVRDHRGVIVSIHDTWVTLVSLCMRHTSMCLVLWRAPAWLSIGMLVRAAYTNMKPCWCAITHQTRNSAEFFPWKLGTSIVVFSQWKLCENSVLYAMTHLRWSVARFWSWKFSSDSKRTREALIKTTSFPKSNLKAQIPLKPQKLMPITHFKLPMSEN